MTHSLRADGFDASEDGTGRGTPIIPILEAGKRCGNRDSLRDGLGIGNAGDPMFTLQAGAQHAIAFDTTQITSKANRCNPRSGDPVHPPAIAFHATQDPCVGDVAFALGRNNGLENGIHLGMAVRRLTPRECERLQGFPDNYTLIDVRGKPAADGPRYKALGNSFAVPVVAWIGRRH